MTQRSAAEIAIVAALAAVIVVCCSRRVANHPVPENARSAGAIRYVVLREGTGLSGRDGVIWSVRWTLLSHTQPGCDHPCVSDALLEKSDERFTPWRELLSSMKEFELRRVWITEPGEPFGFLWGWIYILTTVWGLNRR